MARKAKTEEPLLRPRTGRPPDAKGIVVQLKPDSWKAICQLALDLDTTVQALGVEAFNDLMKKHGRKQTIVSTWD